MDSIRSLDAIFKPASVALIGAPSTPGKLSYDILYNLIQAGFTGPIYPVNPRADEILGLKAYPAIGATPTLRTWPSWSSPPGWSLGPSRSAAGRA